MPVSVPVPPLAPAPVPESTTTGDIFFDSTTIFSSDSFIFS